MYELDLVLRSAARQAWHFYRAGLILAVSVAGLAIALLLIALPQQRAALEADRAELREAQAQAAAGQVSRPVAPRQLKDQFVAQLPPAATVEVVLEAIAGADRTYGLQVGVVASRPVDHSALPWRQQQFDVPVTGSFPQVRRFAAELLDSHPTLALEAVEVRRDSVNDPAVRARLQLSLFYRP